MQAPSCQKIPRGLVTAVIGFVSAEREELGEELNVSITKACRASSGFEGQEGGKSREMVI